MLNNLFVCLLFETFETFWKRIRIQNGKIIGIKKPSLEKLENKRSYFFLLMLGSALCIMSCNLVCSGVIMATTCFNESSSSLDCVNFINFWKKKRYPILKKTRTKGLHSMIASLELQFWQITTWQLSIEKLSVLAI